MSVADWIAIGAMAVFAWLFIGALLDMVRGLSFALAPRADLWATTRQIAARDSLADALLHICAWPLTLFGCENSEDPLQLGHWCRFVDYPEGRYSHEDVIDAAMRRDYPDWDRWKERVNKI